MSSNGHSFVEWKEEFISQERGNRVVHYFLKDSTGNSVLAVVGTERSVRHMFYVVDEEFLNACGSENSAGFKWRSRREVVDWLTSMLSKQHLQKDQSRSPSNDTHAFGSYSLPMSARQPTIPDYMGRVARDLRGHDSDIVWSGIAWTCGKQLRHYPAFCRNGTSIATQSFVFVMAKDEDHYLAYLEDMYEDRKGQKKVKVRWFHNNQEVKGVIHVQNSHSKEVFITPYAQVISAECIDGPATVLTPEHYDKCIAFFPHASLERIHICFRQFRNNRVKPFDLTKLRGYFDQAILLCLNPSPIGCDLSIEEDDEFSAGENVKQRNKRNRSNEGCENFVTELEVTGLSGQRDHRMVHNPVHKKLKYGLSGKRLLSVKHTKLCLRHALPYKVDGKIEFLCQDSGIRGCWFRCTVLQVSRKQIKVQYDDVLDEDGCGNLKEWIPAFRLAVPDKLAMRCSGRLTIRPCPPNIHIPMEHDFGVGTPVDAWWSDGWWEGIVIGVDDREDDTLQIYFSGENLALNIHKKNLRISRDWTGNQWVDVEAKPDILLAISEAITIDAKLSASSPITRDAKFNGFSHSARKISTSAEVGTVEEDRFDMGGSDAKIDGLSTTSLQKAPTSVSLNAIQENSAVIASTNDILNEAEVVNNDHDEANYSVDDVQANHDDDCDNNDDVVGDVPEELETETTVDKCGAESM